MLLRLDESSQLFARYGFLSFLSCQLEARFSVQMRSRTLLFHFHDIPIRWSEFVARVNHEPIRVADSTVVAHDTNTRTSWKGSALLSWFSRRWAALAFPQPFGSVQGVEELFHI